MKKLSSYIQSAIQRKILFWGIHLKEDDSHIGNIKIDPINIRHGLGEYGILIGNKTYWGHGYAREASIAIINYCFSELKLRKICLGVVKDNRAAVRLYEKLGFCVEGDYKRHGFYNNKYCDMLRMAIFNDLIKA